MSVRPDSGDSENRADPVPQTLNGSLKEDPVILSRGLAQK